ncbi:hypothetical protein SB725_12400 [Pseudomonas sp. SIMBA_041]|jgi:pilus assembly protein Flp/PilA
MELFRYLKVAQLEQNAITGWQKNEEMGVFEMPGPVFCRKRVGYYLSINTFLQLLGWGMPTMLMLAKGNHVATVQHPQSLGEVVMSFKSAFQHIKSEIVFYYNLAKDTEGASGIEYAIIAGLAAVAVGVFMGSITSAFTSLTASIKAVLPGP